MVLLHTHTHARAHARTHVHTQIYGKGWRVKDIIYTHKRERERERERRESSGHVPCLLCLDIPGHV